jgi:hypothetical protein
MNRRAAGGLLLGFGLALLLVCLPPSAAAQCAMCQTALTGSPEGRHIAGEFNKAILVMLAAPYLVFGGLVLVLMRQRLGVALVARLRARRPPSAR